LSLACEQDDHKQFKCLHIGVSLRDREEYLTIITQKGNQADPWIDYIEFVEPGIHHIRLLKSVLDIHVSSILMITIFSSESSIILLATLFLV
jgi:hypothetical protein